MSLCLNTGVMHVKPWESHYHTFLCNENLESEMLREALLQTLKVGFEYKNRDKQESTNWGNDLKILKE